MFKTPKSDREGLHHWLPSTPSKPRLSDTDAFLFDEREIFVDKSFLLPNLELTSSESPRKINLRPRKDFKRCKIERGLIYSQEKDLKELVRARKT